MPNKECEICSVLEDSEDLIECPNCGKKVCEVCTTECPVCNSIYCIECLTDQHCPECNPLDVEDLVSGDDEEEV